MFELCIKGDTPEELYDFMRELLHKQNPVTIPGKVLEENGTAVSAPTMPPVSTAPTYPASGVPVSTDAGAESINPIPPGGVNANFTPAAVPISNSCAVAPAVDNQPTAAYAAPVQGTEPPTSASTAANPVPPSAPVVPQVPTAPPPTFTMEQLANAGAQLVKLGKMQDCLELLEKYHISSVSQLDPSNYGEFATGLRALGAQI